VDCGMVIEVERMPHSPSLVRKPDPRLNAGSAPSQAQAPAQTTTRVDSRDGS